MSSIYKRISSLQAVRTENIRNGCTGMAANTRELRRGRDCGLNGGRGRQHSIALTMLLYLEPTRNRDIGRGASLECDHDSPTHQT
jgi:hypothetical protein